MVKVMQGLVIDLSLSRNRDRNVLEEIQRLVIFSVEKRVAAPTQVVVGMNEENSRGLDTMMVETGGRLEIEMMVETEIERKIEIGIVVIETTEEYIAERLLLT